VPLIFDHTEDLGADVVYRADEDRIWGSESPGRSRLTRNPRSTGGRDAITMQEVNTIGIAEVAASHTGGGSPSSLYRMTGKEGGRPGCKEDRERNMDTGLLVLRIVVGLLLVGHGTQKP
jgi:hypothetical protein